MLHLVFKPHRSTLRAQTEDAQKLFVLLKVIPSATLGAHRPPLALAFVVDSSGSMRESGAKGGDGRAQSKLDVAISATKNALADERLVAGDLVSVVQFDDVARVVLPLEPLGDRRAALAALSTLGAYNGGTQIAKGLSAARNELARILQPGVAQRVLLLTDGQAFDAPACRVAAKELADADVPLVAIGVGDDYNEELLRDLAEIGRGRPYHLSQIEALEEVFGIEVASSTREVVTGLRARVQTVSGVSLGSVTRVYPDLAEMKVDESQGAAVVPLGNISAGDYTVFVLEMTIAGRARAQGRARLAQVQLFGNVSNRLDEIESPISELVVSFSTEDAEAEEVSDEVLGYVEQRNVDRLVQNAVQRAQNDVPGAQKSLRIALDITRRLGNVRATRMLQQSLDELGARGKMSATTRKTVLLETRTRTVKTMVADDVDNVPGDDDIHRLTGA